MEETFCADMTMTQRSETMNSVLKRYVSYKNDLFEFFNHFQRSLDDRRYAKSRAYFQDSQSTPAMMFPVEILKHVVRVYTYEVFEQFKDQLCKGIDCKFEIVEEIGHQKMYRITPFGKKFHRHITYDSSKDSISCSCKRFES
ncbi:hypothetical protein ACH5RR_009313 [Cinchona calisaya]|uniref:Protein FAR1-RELATED SEQUENCE n=1 Tax=Cinchona calisaya TaxID=153742 RepID=A0ABD3AG95_9GENT